VISLSVKTLLKHVGSALFLLNSARFLSVRSFGCWVSRVRIGVLVFEYSIRDFFEPQNSAMDVKSESEGGASLL